MATKWTSDAGKAIVKSTFFVPTAEQRRAKAHFWVKWREGPTDDSGRITAAGAISLTGVAALEDWWRDPEFKEWFRNDRSFDQELEYAKDEALEILREIMYSAKNASDRLKAATYLIDAATKKRPVEVKYLDANVAEMDMKQLEEYLANKGTAQGQSGA